MEGCEEGAGFRGLTLAEASGWQIVSCTHPDAFIPTAPTRDTRVESVSDADNKEQASEGEVSPLDSHDMLVADVSPITNFAQFAQNGTSLGSDCIIGELACCTTSVDLDAKDREQIARNNIASKDARISEQDSIITDRVPDCQVCHKVQSAYSRETETRRLDQARMPTCRRASHELHASNSGGQLDAGKTLGDLLLGSANFLGDMLGVQTQLARETAATCVSADSITHADVLLTRGEGGSVGIGYTVISGDTGPFEVISLAPGSPAAQSTRISPGDMIIAVNDMPANKLSLDQAFDLVVGEQGTQVKLSLIRSVKAELVSPESTGTQATPRRRRDAVNLSMRSPPVNENAGDNEEELREVRAREVRALDMLETEVRRSVRLARTQVQ